MATHPPTRCARGSAALALLTAAILLPALAAPAARAASQRVDGVEKNDQTNAIDALVDRFDLADGPGGVVGVYVGAETVYARGFGLANVEHAVPNTPSTVFRLASISKQFTAMTIAILAHRGELDLDADIRDYFPELPAYPEGVVTTRRLVHHTSGVRDYNELSQLAGHRHGAFTLTTNDTALEMLARQRGLNFPPGEEYLYSNSGYLLLALLVERVAGRTIAEFAAEEIFAPLGMASSRFNDDHTHIVPRRAYGYTADGEGWRRVLSLRNFVGGGGVFATAEDMARWFTHLDNLDGGLRDILYGVDTLNDGSETQYAFGFLLREDRGLPIAAHSGSFAGFRTIFLRYPGEKLAVFVATNGGRADPERLARAAADAYLPTLVPDLAPRARPELAPPSRPATAPFTAEDLPAYAGVYYAPELGATYAVAASDGRLELTIPGVERTPLRAVEAGVFRDGPLTLRFRRSDAGEITDFTLDRARVRGILFERADVDVARDVLETYVGSYEMAPPGRNVFAVTLEEGGLFVQTGGDKFALRAASPTTFFVEGQQAQVVFAAGDTAGATRMSVRFNGRIFWGRKSR